VVSTEPTGEYAMISKNKRPPTAVEKKHIESVKSLPCSVCGEFPPSECHEQKQGQWFTSVALCGDCHRGSTMGWHGQKRAFVIRKMDMLDALNETIKMLVISNEV